jgi:hypothetical protein
MIALSSWPLFPTAQKCNITISKTEKRQTNNYCSQPIVLVTLKISEIALEAFTPDS